MICFFFNATGTTVIYTEEIVGSVRCVEETDSEVIPQLNEYAAGKGYIFNGPVTIDYELDESLPTGRFTVHSAAVAGVDGSDASATQIRRAALVLEVNGVRHPLNPPGLVLSLIHISEPTRPY